MIRRASATSASVGAKIRFATGAVFGWMRVLPSNPRIAPLAAGDLEPGVVGEVEVHAVEGDEAVGPRGEEHGPERDEHLGPAGRVPGPEVLHEVARPHHESGEARRRRGDGGRGEHAPGRLDHAPERERHRRAGGGEGALHRPDLLCRLHLRQDHRVRAAPCGEGEVLGAPRRPRAVHPHDHLPVAEAARPERLAHGAPGLLLRRGRHRVLEVEDEAVHRKRPRLLEGASVRAGDVEEGAAGTDGRRHHGRPRGAPRVPDARGGRKPVAARPAGHDPLVVTVSSAALALLLAQRAFSIPPRGSRGRGRPELRRDRGAGARPGARSGGRRDGGGGGPGDRRRGRAPALAAGDRRAPGRARGDAARARRREGAARRRDEPRRRAPAPARAGPAGPGRRRGGPGARLGPGGSRADAERAGHRRCDPGPRGRPAVPRPRRHDLGRRRPGRPAPDAGAGARLGRRAERPAAGAPGGRGGSLDRGRS